MLWGLGLTVASVAGDWLTSWYLDNAGTADEPSPWLPVVVLGMVLVTVVAVVWAVAVVPVLAPVLVPLAKLAFLPIVLTFRLLEQVVGPVLQLVGLSRGR